MFEEIAGLPLHPLAVHAAVVFVPLLGLTAAVYALVPRLRAKLAWVAATLAVVAPASAGLAVLAGNAFQQARELPLEDTSLGDHRTFGLSTLVATVVLGVATLALVWARRGGRGSRGRAWLAGALAAVVVIAAGTAVVLVVLTGDSGSREVWGG